MTVLQGGKVDHERGKRSWERLHPSSSVFRPVDQDGFFSVILFLRRIYK